ncbi:MAG: phosphoglucosamine mutase [Acidobacteriota bacterium]
MKPIKTLKVSISGIRGVVGDSLKPLLVCRFAESFATYLGEGSILVGRDTRTSGEMVTHAVLAGLMSSGMSVIDVDICPVPTIQFLVRKLRCKGGIAITASHNPPQWNALKFIKSSGCFLNRYEAEELLSVYHQEEFKQVEASRLQPVAQYPAALGDHLRHILQTLRPRLTPRLKVVVDCCDGAGSTLTPLLVKELGCDVVPLNCKPSGYFPRPPEPVPENLSQLCETVRRHHADVGFAQDADADRLAIVSDQGVAIGEEYTLALCARTVLAREQGPVVTNLSTSRMIEDIAGSFGCPVHRSRVGEVNVTELMEERGAIFGGEGNGGVIYPRVNMARDSFVGMTLVVDLIRSSGFTVTELIDQLPRYRMAKSVYEMHPHRIPALIEELTTAYGGEKLNLLDGLKIEREEGWIHIRPSNTEPILRVVIEARDEVTLKAFHEEILGWMSALPPGQVQSSELKG